MTTLNTGAGASASIFPDTSGAGLLALFAGSVASGTPTSASVTVQTASGLLVVLNGASLAGFGSNGLPSAGLIGSLSVRTAGGLEVYGLTQMLVTAANLSTAVAASDTAALEYMFFAGADTLSGSAFGDRLVAGNGADTLTGGGGNDTLEGGAGNDWFQGGAGNDTIDGGAGYDTLSFADVSTAVVASLAAGSASTGGDTDSLVSIESLIGSSGNDELTGGIAVTVPVLPNLLKPATLYPSYGSAFSLDGSFDLEADAQITNSTLVPHATVYARAASSGYFSEYYSFTTTAANSIVTIDIDGTDPGFDASFYLYRLESNGYYNYEQFVSGSSSVDPGSTSTLDPYLARMLLLPATYVVVVQSSGWVSFNPNYTLHVSVDSGNSRPMLDGGAGDDTLTGGTANETLTGGAGSDTVNGGAGDDLVVALAGDLVAGESMAGGDGTDTLRLSAEGNADALDLRDYVVSGFESLDIRAAEFTMSAAQAAAFGSSFSILNSRSGGAEVLRITGAQAVLDMSGWTLTNWESFRDVVVLEGHSTATAYTGSSAYERVDYSSASAGISVSLLAPVNNTGDAQGDSHVGIEEIIGTGYGDVLAGDDEINILFGGAGNDVLYGFGGADNLQAGAGNDLIEGGAGSDFIDGGDGFDTVSYASSPELVVRMLGGADQAGSHTLGDVLFNVEALSGSAFADILGGASGDDMLSGAFGSDWLLGLGGNDRLYGESGNDVLIGGAGADVLDGGQGDDVAYYGDATAGVVASLATGGSGGEADGDSYFGVENLWGSGRADTLTGDAAANQVYGFAGADVLDGAGGEDIVYGGSGADTLTGGAGADSFFFLQWQTDGGDTLTDFTGGADRIMLSRFWFGIDTTGPAAVVQAGQADFITSGGSVNYRPSFLWNSGTGVLSFDPDGVGDTSVIVLATLQAGASLALSDIWSA